jgi:hypothetical protein
MARAYRWRPTSCPPAMTSQSGTEHASAVRYSLQAEAQPILADRRAETVGGCTPTKVCPDPVGTSTRHHRPLGINPGHKHRVRPGGGSPYGASYDNQGGSAHHPACAPSNALRTPDDQHRPFNPAPDAQLTSGNAGQFLCGAPAGIEPATPSLPSMRGEFTTPYSTSRAHTTLQVRAAVERLGVGPREVTCSAVSGKSLARRPHRLGLEWA